MLSARGGGGLAVARQQRGLRAVEEELLLRDTMDWAARWAICIIFSVAGWW